MVYIVKSNQSSENYDNWVCGGALISEWQVLTSASCLTEMSHVYVIAGYRKYVNGRGIEVDECTRARKNRVVKTCVPKSYNLTHEDQSKWMALDIGVATVEKPYNFSDKSWRRQCSYTPQAIRISYDGWLTNKDTDVVAFGWGGTHWRTATDVLDHNSKYLNEIAGIIVVKSVCKEAFDAQEVHNVIQKYMICVAEGGNLNGDGTLRDLGPKTRTGCRRSGNNTGCKSDIVSENTPVKKQPIPSRRQALCQNDHGGPLVTWRGAEEVLIGVACSSIVDVNTLACTPPSLFTSVHCTGRIIACLIARTKEARRACSEKIKTDGLHIQESAVNWGGLDEDYFACVNQRRLTNGKRTKVDKPYMVYLVQSNQSSKNLDNYLCAGALISQWQILTAAACLMELTHMYAIAGYKKYVNGRGIDYDECTRTKKNRVMKTCVPKNYKLSYTNRSMYVTLDIGVAFVERRYDPNDITWLDDCSYIPKPIRISYAAELIEPGNDVVAFGWGGSFYRTPTDVLDNNSPFLQEISTLIISKQRCKSHYKTHANNMWKSIDMYLVCVEGVGNLDGDGNMMSIGSTSNSGCHRRDGSGCDRGESRRKSGARHANNSVFHQPVPSRRQSLCQNDHGAPLITWMGSEEVLIGIGASSVVDAKQLFCMAPSLFTSTHCVGKVVECLTALTKESRRRCAEGIQTQGIGIEDIDFDWDKMPEVPDAVLDPNESDEKET